MPKENVVSFGEPPETQEIDFESLPAGQFFVCDGGYLMQKAYADEPGLNCQIIARRDGSLSGVRYDFGQADDDQVVRLVNVDRIEF